MSKKKERPKKGFEALSDETACEIINEAWKRFEGDCTVFISAAGALMFGRAVGWQGVRVVMSAATYRKYEAILGIRFREKLPARCHDADSLRGIKMVDGFGKFWQALSASMVPALEGKMTF